MFCQKCGFQMPDNAKFCGNCGNVVSQASSNASAAEPAPTQSAVGQAAQPTAGTYQAPPVNQQGYSAQPAQQSYNAQAQQPYAPTYAAPRSSKSPIARLLLFIGGGLSVAGFFLPLIAVNSYGYSIGFSLMDMSFGTGVVGTFDISLLPMVLFLAGGVLSVLFALIKPKMGLLAGILSAAAMVYLFVASSVGGTSFVDALQYAAIGFYLTCAGIVATFIGSFLAMAKK